MRGLHRCVHVVNFEVSWYILVCALSIHGIFLHKLYAGMPGNEKEKSRGQPGGKWAAAGRGPPAPREGLGNLRENTAGIFVQNHVDYISAVRAP